MGNLQSVTNAVLHTSPVEKALSSPKDQVVIVQTGPSEWERDVVAKDEPPPDFTQLGDIAADAGDYALFLTCLFERHRSHLTR